MKDTNREALKVEPGSDLHLTFLMAPHSLNLVVGEDRAALLAWGRDVWTASRKQALEEAAGICEGIERKKWETLRDGGKLTGIGPMDCASSIRERAETGERP